MISMMQRHRALQEDAARRVELHRSPIRPPSATEPYRRWPSFTAPETDAEALAGQQSEHGREGPTVEEGGQATMPALSPQSPPPLGRGTLLYSHPPSAVATSAQVPSAVGPYAHRAPPPSPLSMQTAGRPPPISVDALLPAAASSLLPERPPAPYSPNALYSGASSFQVRQGPPFPSAMDSAARGFVGAASPAASLLSGVAHASTSGASFAPSASPPGSASGNSTPQQNRRSLSSSSPVAQGLTRGFSCLSAAVMGAVSSSPSGV